MAEKTIHPVIATVSATRHILKHFKLRASKRLGQNFLIDRSIVSGIVDAAEIEEGEPVLEIGPGIGTLTQGLLEAGAHVTAVELDKKLPTVLAETLAGYDNFSLVQGDILKLDIRSLMNDQPFKVVANLPYYITSQIILTLLEQKLPIKKIVTMVQKEVAERMIANPENLSLRRTLGRGTVFHRAAHHFRRAAFVFHAATGSHELRDRLRCPIGTARRGRRKNVFPSRARSIRAAAQNSDQFTARRGLRSTTINRGIRQVRHRSETPRGEFDFAGICSIIRITLKKLVHMYVGIEESLIQG